MPSSSVLTLVAAPGGLDESAVGGVRHALADAGATVDSARWLAPDQAVDLTFAGLDHATAEAVGREALDEAPIDVAVQSTAGRRKKLLVADLESTIIRNEMLDELADLAGRGAEVAAVTARAMNGEIDFCQSVRDRVATLAGQPVSLLEQARARIEDHPGAASLVATCRRHGVTTALVSGGFVQFADAIGARLGFDHVQANRLIFEDGALTGRVAEPILDRDAKQVALEAHCRALGITPNETAAVGDGANDLALLGAAGLGVAYHAKPAVAAAARFRIDHGDLTTLLSFQGYRRDEIVDG